MKQAAQKKQTEKERKEEARATPEDASTPMDAEAAPAAQEKYTDVQKVALSYFVFTPTTFNPEASALWKAEWKQSLGPGLEEAERAMRSFHLPNGDVRLYEQELDPAYDDESFYGRELINVCYLLYNSVREGEDDVGELDEKWELVRSAYEVSSTSALSGLLDEAGRHHHHHHHRTTTGAPSTRASTRIPSRPPA